MNYINKRHKLLKRLTQFEEKLKTLKLPETIELDDASLINDVPKFIESHIVVLRSKETKGRIQQLHIDRLQFVASVIKRYNELEDEESMFDETPEPEQLPESSNPKNIESDWEEEEKMPEPIATKEPIMSSTKFDDDEEYVAPEPETQKPKEQEVKPNEPELSFNDEEGQISMF